MALQINLERHHLMEGPLGDDEIKLVREELNWHHKPFKLPINILNAWRKIGNKGKKIRKKME